MKLYKKLVILIATGSLISCGNLVLKEGDIAVKYNDKMVTEQKKIIAVHNIYNERSYNASIDSVDLLYNNLVSQIKSSIEVIKKMGAFKQDSSMKVSCLNYFDEYLNVANNEYYELTKWYKTPYDSLNYDAEVARIDSTIKAGDEKIENYRLSFEAVQKAWGYRHNVRILDSE